MRCLPIVPLCLALAVTGSAAAQQQPDLATDNELLAAYCIGALQTGFGTSVEQARIQHFRAYLAARGAFTIYRSRQASLGLNVAVERGYADGIACHHKHADGACAGPDRCVSDTQSPF